MKSVFFALLIFIAGNATAQNWRFQNSFADGIGVNSMYFGVDINNLPSDNFFALLSNDNDFDVHVTVSLETDVNEFRRTVDVIIPAGAYEMKVPLGLIYWSKDWSALEASKIGTWIDVVIHEPRLTRKLWSWIYLPFHSTKGNPTNRAIPPGFSIGKGYYFTDNK